MNSSRSQSFLLTCLPTFCSCDQLSTNWQRSSLAVFFSLRYRNSHGRMPRSHSPRECRFRVFASPPRTLCEMLWQWLGLCTCRPCSCGGRPWTSFGGSSCVWYKRRSPLPRHAVGRSQSLEHSTKQRSLVHKISSWHSTYMSRKRGHDPSANHTCESSLFVAVQAIGTSHSSSNQ